MLVSIIINIKKFAKIIIKNLNVLNFHLPHILKIYKFIINRDWNQEFENHLLSIKTERQNMIHPNSHPTYNERHQKIIEMIDLAIDKYKTAVNTQKMNEQVIIDNIIKELDRKRKIAINKKEKTILKDEVLEYEKKKMLLIIFFS